jgi:hypothetical protein
MKTSLLSCIAAGALLAAAPLNAQTAPAAAPAASSASPEVIVQPNGQKIAHVSNIKTLRANREFQQNVNTVQRLRQELIELNKRQQQAVTTPEKEVLKAYLEAGSKQLADADAVMQKTYGFTIMRQYVVQVTKSRIYTPISEDDYKKLPSAEQNDDAKIVSRTGKDKDGKDVTVHFKFAAAIDGVAKNELFINDSQQVRNLKGYQQRLQQVLAQTKGTADKKELEEALRKTNDGLDKLSAEGISKYGFNPTQDNVQEFEEINLYVAVSDEDLKKMEEASKKQEAEKKNAPAPAAGAAPAPATSR